MPGVSSALLTLWSVSAATTLEWMLDFYRRIASNTIDKQSKALAFQQATLALCERYPDDLLLGSVCISPGNGH